MSRSSSHWRKILKEFFAQNPGQSYIANKASRVFRRYTPQIAANVTRTNTLLRRLRETQNSNVG